jgi:hypothetical protein
MKSRYLLLVALSTLAVSDAPLPGQIKGGKGEPFANKYGWLSSLEEGKAQARKSGKPLMVVLRCVP